MPVLRAALLVTAQLAAGSPIPTRTAVGSLHLEAAKTVTHVEAMRVDFLPSQAMPQHMHPVPVVCFVAQGRLAVRVGNQPVRTISKGDATLEQAGEIVHYFRNLSATQPAQLYCTILAGDADRQYSVMMPR